MENFTELLNAIDGVVWGIPLMVLIIGGGLLLTIRLGVVQFRKLGLALRYMVRNEVDGEGEISSFGALCTAMSATVGTGNIVGVAGAVTIGGPGALFWMLFAACIGMATKFSEGLLAVKFRVMDENGHALGGPFYYIENGMGSKWKWLAKLFALFGVLAGLLGIGTITQVNGIAGAVKTFFDPNSLHTIGLFGTDYSIAVVVTAIVVAGLTALVIIGGIKRISKVAEMIVPAMIIVYVTICVVILLANITEIPGAVADVFAYAFGAKAIAGGAVGSMLIAMQMGIARGLFSNEAGLGSAPIAAAAAQTKEPVRQGFVSMTGTFMDTIIVCNMTGLAILVTDSWNIGLEGVEVTINAFQTGLGWNPQIGSFLLMCCLALFAFTTILGWDYYSERCLEYLSGRRQNVVLTYRWLYVLAVLVGPFLTVEAVWTIAEIFNGFMAVPNLIALVALSGVVTYETKDYLKRLNSGQIQEGKSRFDK